MQTIYYVFEKATGMFAGSGVSFIDTPLHGSTDIRPPPRNWQTETCKWDGNAWIVLPKYTSS